MEAVMHARIFKWEGAWPVERREMKDDGVWFHVYGKNSSKVFAVVHESDCEII